MPARFGKTLGFSYVYTLKFLGKAVQDLRKIAPPFQLVIKEKLLILAENPDILKNNITRLTGTKEEYYRLRIGSYRVIYEKREKELIILVIRMGHRKEIYR
jgi:mRNA interferase RelE/StbE